MDRRKQDELPKMQVGFIDAICMPLYRVSTFYTSQGRSKTMNSFQYFLLFK